MPIKPRMLVTRKDNTHGYAIGTMFKVESVANNEATLTRINDGRTTLTLPVNDLEPVPHAVILSHVQSYLQIAQKLTEAANHAPRPTPEIDQPIPT